MHKHRPAIITSPIISLNRAYVRMIPLGLTLAVAGIGSAFAMSGADLLRLRISWLTSFCALLTVSLGCLFFVIVQHLTRAGWSVTVRRIAEVFAMCLLPMSVLFLPILLPLLAGESSIYVWNRPGWTDHGHGPVAGLEKLKAAYLSSWFYTARVVGCFVVWGLMAWYYYGNSLRQDRTGDPQISRRLQRSSTWIMIVFAVTLVFASFDFEMSLSPLWFSTMFPVYFFSGAFMSGCSAILLTAALLQRSGRITDEITTEHYHDLAKLMFAFVFFWGYIAFSQFMLIWYANIPEETFWFDYRLHGWTGWSLLLLFGHLFIPFLGIMARTVRRNRTYMMFAAVYLLVMHWVDHFWLIMPEFSRNECNFSFLIDVPLAIGMIGLYIAIFALIAGDRPLVARQDPRLGDALNYHNH